ncbi:HDOD domain-containing protein [Piscinibacter sakaiensis]|uniref:HDOD domain-containing protein n=1 Tax=Piscinibacter sakaiensis TaxID=1547922 RepID=UPI003AABB84A
MPDLQAWTAWFAAAQIPVRSDTAEAIEALRENEDAVDANLLGELIATDPLMTLKLMAHASARRSARQLTDPETVTAALVMMGISPFFRDFREQALAEDHLAGNPLALAGLQEVVSRGRRAADFALAFAVHRLDDDTPVIHQAALLHDFAEMLLWVHAPTLALRMQAERDAHPCRRSADIQRELLNVELGELQQSLMRHWRLPELLIRVSDDKHADHPSIRTVLLAVRVARHSARSWDNPALPDDIAELSDLLQLSPAAVSDLLADIER